MAPHTKIQPNLDQSSTKVLNLTVLQRIDPNVEEILITIAHVVFYEFNIDNNEWSRKDVEGSLFVVKRNAQPRFQFIVMNRRNTDNLVENLLGDFEYEIQVPYLLYRNAAQDVNGIWFYHQHDCEEVAKLFSRILNAYSKVTPKDKISSTRSEFDELGAEAVPSTAVMEGPPEPSTAPTITNVPEDPSFITFFNAATNIGKTSNTSNPGQPHLLPGVSPLPSRSSNLPPTLVPVMQSSAPSLPPSETSDMSINNRPTNLVSPATFYKPPSSSASMMLPLSLSKPTAAPLHLPLQRPYGAPLLQSYPPPTPPPSLAPTIPYNGPFISRDKVREALMRLVQNTQFIDMFYEELLKGTP